MNAAALHKHAAVNGRKIMVGDGWLGSQVVVGEKGGSRVDADDGKFGIPL